MSLELLHVGTVHGLPAAYVGPPLRDLLLERLIGKGRHAVHASITGNIKNFTCQSQATWVQPPATDDDCCGPVAANVRCTCESLNAAATVSPWTSITAAVSPRDASPLSQPRRRHPPPPRRPSSFAPSVCGAPRFW